MKKALACEQFGAMRVIGIGPVIEAVITSGSVQQPVIIATYVG